DALEEKGYSFSQAEVEYVPQTTVTLTDEDAIKNMNKMIDMLEDSDDVQNISHNWEE
ncbi:MAG: YebC/PmpR family DNA-binding transcriptional regulator, partial [Clostridia bacterium]|nr:YebC/PmpR family DNA-binding transcriptional regulator [Clostridia bacterium]